LQHEDRLVKPAELLEANMDLLLDARLPGPILDLAAGDCHNAIFLAQFHLKVIGCDKSAEALHRGERMATRLGVTIETWQVDLEVEGTSPLPEGAYGAIIAFYYLHRSLIPSIRRALKTGGVLIYETYTVDQPRFGRPHNPDFLLKPGELRQWFEDWKILHDFEGERENPSRSVAQIVCRK
jgi:tellurite methyltransferase